ncbi:hypothetical protein L1077_13040 [Pseudoalteromonas luteoviolacea]|uniref:hypothetical protein n=1 Tax=Pseudoalteromonas luteoviolacea TaxID=43657 RepID=UPI001F19D6E3|nr:hypothetical protein [Pseudoalteromonas luteoviolacea]MCF6440355.1 hypothetical protein [Pseudoalteromonas luteoviolacea]
MSQITTRFEVVYRENNLSDNDYYVYGSGGGSLDILQFIEENGLRAPIAVIDREAKKTPIDVLNAYELKNVDHPVVVSSISFYGEIKHALVKHNEQFKSKLIPLMPYSENVTNRLYISESAWNEYQSLSESAYRGIHNWNGSQLQNQGFYISKSGEDFAHGFRLLCEKLPEQVQLIDSSQYDFDYFSNALGEQNTDLKRLEVTPAAQLAIEDFLEKHYEEIAQQLGSHWKVVNCRITKLAKVLNSNVGSNKLHLDNMPKPVKKILLYITPPSADTGSTMIQLEDGSQITVEGEAGTFLLFQNSRLQHRGLSTDKLNRLVCELTIATNQYKDTQVRTVGLVSEYPYKPWQRCGAYKVNLGGGANFNGENWICYDECDGANIQPISFTPKTILPNLDNSCSLVYSSHFFEHIDHETLTNLLTESWRILQPDGDLLIKIPDFDSARTAGLNGNMQYFNQFSQSKELLKNWQKHGVDPKCALSHAANVITSFWNSDYGHLYKDQASARSGYCGPVRLTSEEYAEIFKIESINEISKILTQKVRDSEKDFQFNHQNAWTKLEFINLVSSFGFELVSTSYELIEYAFPDVPDFEAHKPISNYYYFKKIANTNKGKS